MELTKEQLIEGARSRVSIAQAMLESGITGGCRRDYAVELAVHQIALAALTAPELPPEGVGAKGRSMDANYRRQGAKVGWNACLTSILGKLIK
ncbi:hypothetical protein CGX53_20645 [Salmonella enterica]|uniref:hypothetical protein n=1 Tax=Salmonella enterica TaxID=28901 RepID=UPI0009AE4BEA|nr:hypothetical protein [Salmonella enterica]EBV8483683.1 hypothetical protein [Salmonella enterica subsp. enterica serovar Ago]EBX3143139.1 hypothetical protein [Salmonella enterica subsp. enterica serovar Ealing]ECI6612571.1 hypothetical protein [Salmonella enterica subsp. enterica]EAM3588040.1 hypothetical protein [Salmonella enterica]EAN1764996.1 hypothetical protein [Salmonella enterica]